MVPNGWELRELKDLTTIYDGTHSTPKYVEYGVPFYSVEHLTKGDFSKTKFISEEVFDKENKRVKLERDDILMTRIGDIGTAVHLDWNVRASFYVSLALLKASSHFDSSFMTQYVNSSEFHRELWKRIIHVAFPKKINLGEIGKCHVLLPPMPEQRKIAKILSTWDKTISTTERLIENSKQQKKALMQQLLTGKKRLLDDSGKPFSDEWKVATFDEALTKLTDYTANGSFASLAENVTVFDEENYSLWIMGRTLKSGNYDREVRYTDERGYEFLKKTKLFGGELLMPKTGDVGKAYLFPHLGKKATLADNVFLLDFKSIILNDFAKWFINSEKFQFELERMMYGTSQKTIVKKVLRRMHICVPSIAEQIKIVSVLTNADKEIELLEQQAADLKHEKKALMQQLLTGKRIVKVDDKEVA